MKPYVKPELYFENFVLSQMVASCDIQINFGDVSSCISESGTIFSTPYTNGFTQENCGTVIATYCYTGNANGLPKVSQS